MFKEWVNGTIHISNDSCPMYIWKEVTGTASNRSIFNFDIACLQLALEQIGNLFFFEFFSLLDNCRGSKLECLSHASLWEESNFLKYLC